MKAYGTASLRNGKWTIVAEPHVAMLLKRWFKKSDRGEAGKVTLSHSPEVCRDLEWFADRYPLVFQPEDVLQAGADAYREQVARLADYFSADFKPRETAAMRLQPRPYQARSAAICGETGLLLVADELGLGKTCTAITLLADPERRPAVVVPPVHLQRQWAAEVLKFTPNLQVHIVKTAAPYKLPEFFGVGPDVLIVPYSKLAGWAEVLAAYVKTIVFDEVHELRRAGSGRYNAAEHVAHAAKWKMGLSATPIWNYGGEIFNLFHVLAPGRLGDREEFIREWCKPYATSSGQHALKDPRAFGSWLRDQGLMVRHTRKEVGRELPPVISTVHTVEADMERLAEMEGNAADLARVILRDTQESRGEKMHASEELSMRLRQAIGIAKAPYVADFVQLLVESGEQVLLGGWHREVYGIWEERLKAAGVTFCYYTGTESPAAKEESKRKFLSGEAKVMFLSLRSGAGLDGLQTSCKVVVIGELDWSPAVHEQLIGRLHRDGQTEPVLVYYLVAESGADPIISQVLGLKRSQVEGIREPRAPLATPISLEGAERIKSLAQDYLRRRGLRLEEAA